jgi:hypothetical protein
MHPAPAASGVEARPPATVSRLVGAVVPGRVSFAGEVPVQTGSIALYRHPADRNAAATGVQAGRVLDVTG